MATTSSGLKPSVLLVQLGAVGVVAYALLMPADFGSRTHAHPFAMGFLKLFFLGAFGELLKCRIVRGAWALDHVWERACVWGIFGWWFTLAFPGFSALTEALVAGGLWPGSVNIIPDQLWMAFSKSLWINLLGMFAWGMMLTHEYFNHLIRTRWRVWGLADFAANSDAGFALAFLPKTILFWVPAHTFTFAMPAEWRVFIAALLAIVLGFLLSVGRRSSGAQQPSKDTRRSEKPVQA